MKSSSSALTAGPPRWESCPICRLLQEIIGDAAATGCFFPACLLLLSPGQVRTEHACPVVRHRCAPEGI